MHHAGSSPPATPPRQALPDWAIRVDAAVEAMAAARTLLLRDPTSHDQIRDEEDPDRVKAYGDAVNHFLNTIKQAESEDVNAHVYIQEKINKFRQDALRLAHMAVEGSEAKHNAKMVIKELGRVEAYIQASHAMSDSIWSDSTAAGDSSPEHTREPQSPGHHRRPSQQLTREQVGKRSSPPSVSVKSYLDTLIDESEQILTSLACRRASKVLVASETQEISSVSGCRLRASTP